MLLGAQVSAGAPGEDHGAAKMTWRNLRIGFVADDQDDRTVALTIASDLRFEVPGEPEAPPIANIAVFYRSGERPFADWAESDYGRVVAELVNGGGRIGAYIAHSVLTRGANEEQP